jgi:hypothetical protein
MRRFIASSRLRSARARRAVSGARAGEGTAVFDRIRCAGFAGGSPAGALAAGFLFDVATGASLRWARGGPDRAPDPERAEPDRLDFIRPSFRGVRVPSGPEVPKRSIGVITSIVRLFRNALRVPKNSWGERAADPSLAGLPAFC